MTSAAKHTPGPWGYGLTKGGQLAACVSKKGVGDIALLYRSSETSSCSGINENEAHANARLVAAAPELLNALKRLVDEHHSSRYSALEKRMADWQVAREAITKAESSE